MASTYPFERPLENSVKTIATEDDSQAVPSAQATGEIGGRARSGEVRKQGASAMEEQRSIKTHTSTIADPSNPPTPSRSAAKHCCRSSSRFGATELAHLLSEFDPASAEFVAIHANALRPLFRADAWAAF